MKQKNFLDSIYQNRALLIRYFIVALVLSVLRYFAAALFSGIMKSGFEFCAWAVFAIIFFPCLKIFVFKTKSEHIYALLRQIIIYIICMTVLWYSYRLFISFFILLFRNETLALSFGGMVNEIFCAYLMVKVVFKNKK